MRQRIEGAGNILNNHYFFYPKKIKWDAFNSILQQSWHTQYSCSARGLSISSVIFERWRAYLAVWVPELVHTHGQERGFLFGFGFQQVRGTVQAKLTEIRRVVLR